MFFNKVALAVLGIGIFGLPSLFAASSNPTEDLSQDTKENQWSRQMERTYIPNQISEYHRSEILKILKKIPEEYQEGVEDMANTYISPYEMDGYYLFEFFKVLCVLGHTQPWVKKMANVYIPYPRVMPKDESFTITQTLSQTPVDKQKWVEDMANTYITDPIKYHVLRHTYGVIYYSGLIIYQLRETTLEQQAWVAHMAKTYITPEMDGRQRWMMLESLRETPLEKQEWVSDRAKSSITKETDGWQCVELFQEWRKCVKPL